MRMLAKTLLLTHLVAVAGGVALSFLDRENAGVRLGDWLTLVVLYALIFAAPTVLLTFTVAGLLRREFLGWRHRPLWPDIIGLALVPCMAAVVIGVTNDGDPNGWKYLAGCFLIMLLSLTLRLGLSRRPTPEGV